MRVPVKRERGEFLIERMTRTTELQANNDPSWEPTKDREVAIFISCNINNEAALIIINPKATKRSLMGNFWPQTRLERAPEEI